MHQLETPFQCASGKLDRTMEILMLPVQQNRLSLTITLHDIKAIANSPLLSATMKLIDTV